MFQTHPLYKAFPRPSRRPIWYERIQLQNDTDLTLKCAGRTWHVHQEILCAKSEFFYMANYGEFLEARTKVFNLDPDDVGVIDQMLQFFYEDDYDVVCDDGSKAAKALEHSKVAAAGDKYLSTELVSRAESKFRELLGTKFDMHYEGIHEIVQMAYDDPPVPEMFSKILVRHVVSNLFNYMWDKKFRAMIQELPELARDIMFEQFENWQADWTSEDCCEKCFAPRS